MVRRGIFRNVNFTPYGRAFDNADQRVKYCVEMFSSKEKKEQWKLIKGVYEDPDKAYTGVEGFSWDAVMSLWRLYNKYGLTNTLVQEYEAFREVPVFFFPREKKSINVTRASMLNDRIDYTLLDLKNYYENPSRCVLTEAYAQPKTKQWLDSYDSFEELVEDNWPGITGIFVDEEYNVIDLETNEILTSPVAGQGNIPYSDEYYNNLREKVLEYRRSFM